jgi:hypothetical protein
MKHAVKMWIVVLGVSTSSGVVAADFCAVSNFGVKGPCFQTLSMCQSWVGKSGGTCVVNNETSKQPATPFERDLTKGAAAGALLREILGGGSGAWGSDREEKEDMHEYFRRRIEEENREKVKAEIEVGCKGGVRFSTATAKSWSAYREDIEAAISEQKSVPAKEKLRKQLMVDAEKEYQEHLDEVFKHKRRREKELDEYMGKYSGDDRRERYQTLSLVTTIENMVFKSSAVIGWKNPSASSDRLERLMSENCLDVMRLD